MAPKSASKSDLKPTPAGDEVPPSTHDPAEYRQWIAKLKDIGSLADHIGKTEPSPFAPAPLVTSPLYLIEAPIESVLSILANAVLGEDTEWRQMIAACRDGHTSPLSKIAEEWCLREGVDSIRYWMSMTSQHDLIFYQLAQLPIQLRASLLSYEVLSFAWVTFACPLLTLVVTRISALYESLKMRRMANYYTHQKDKNTALDKAYRHIYAHHLFLQNGGADPPAGLPQKQAAFYEAYEIKRTIASSAGRKDLHPITWADHTKNIKAAVPQAWNDEDLDVGLAASPAFALPSTMQQKLQDPDQASSSSDEEGPATADDQTPDQAEKSKTPKRQAAIKAQAKADALGKNAKKVRFQDDTPRGGGRGRRGARGGRTGRY